MSLGTGRPIVLRDENTIRHCRVLLNHPLASPTDVRLISQVELIAQKSMLLLKSTGAVLLTRSVAQIYETLTPLVVVSTNTLAFIRRANVALDKWWQDCDELHSVSIFKSSCF